VGRFNDVVADYAVKTLAALPGAPRVWAVGERVHARLGDAGLPLMGLIGHRVGDPEADVLRFRRRIQVYGVRYLGTTLLQLGGLDIGGSDGRKSENQKREKPKA
jgi:hypothetical protein